MKINDTHLQFASQNGPKNKSIFKCLINFRLVSQFFVHFYSIYKKIDRHTATFFDKNSNQQHVFKNAN